MQYILFNLKANNGKGKENADKYLETVKCEYELVNVCETDIKEWVKSLKEEDLVVLCGGDGTLNRFANDLYGTEVPCDILLFGAGTGNDFLRDIKENYDQSNPVSIKKFIEKLPTVKIKDKEVKFINGIGFGIDGMCCEVADEMKAKGAKEINYTTLSIKLMLFKYKCPKSTIIVDGVAKEYNKTWIASAMNGRYYGGGMKAAPDQDRLGDTLTNVVFHDKGRIATLMAFPSIFKGEHVNKKKIVEVRTGKEITVKFDRPMALQIDGETVTGVTEYTAWK